MLTPFLAVAALLPSPADGPTSLVFDSELQAPVPVDGSGLGNCVAIHGNTAVVGSPIDGGNQAFQGVAYVWEKTTTGWMRTARLQASDGGSGDQFGQSVAVEGDFVFVGADNVISSNGLVLNGAVYVFERQDGSWPEVARIEPLDGASFDGFGASVAVSNGTLVVGAPQGGASGKAYVYTGAGAAWTEQSKLVPTSGGLSGTVVDVDGDTALVTSPSFNSSRGAATVFVRSGSTWTPQRTFTDSTPANGELFAQSGALDGDVVALGSARLNGGGGGVVLFRRVGTTWSIEDTLTPTASAFPSAFGVAVGLEGDTLLVGASDDGVLGSFQGAARVFTRGGATWAETATLTPAVSPDDSEEFGFSVAVSGGRFLVGDPMGYAAGDHGEATLFRVHSAAGVAMRNSGSNQPSYAAGLPVLGAMWSASVDVSLTGNTTAFIVLTLAPAELLLPSGPTLLVNPARRIGPLLGPQLGPQALFTGLLPCDPSLAGRTVYSQALHIGGGVPFTLSNAQDMCLGF